MQCSKTDPFFDHLVGAQQDGIPPRARARGQGGTLVTDPPPEAMNNPSPFALFTPH
jgi:hypothetical protein